MQREDNKRIGINWCEEASVIEDGRWYITIYTVEDEAHLVVNLFSLDK